MHRFAVLEDYTLQQQLYFLGPADPPPGLLGFFNELEGQGE